MQTHTITPPLSHPELGTQVTHPRSQGDTPRLLPIRTSTGRAPRCQATSQSAKTPSERRKFGLLPNVPGIQELAAGPFFTD